MPATSAPGTEADDDRSVVDDRAPAPSIYSAHPRAQAITIVGANFGAVAPVVRLGNAALRVQAYNPAVGSFAVDLPDGTAAGTYLLRVTSAGKTASMSVTLGAVGPVGPPGTPGPPGLQGPPGPTSILRTGTSYIGGSPPVYDEFIGAFPVVFQPPLPVVPRVVVTPHEVDRYLDVFAFTVKDVTQNGFNVVVCRVDEPRHAWSQDLYIDWIAFAPG